MAPRTLIACAAACLVVLTGPTAAQAHGDDPRTESASSGEQAAIGAEHAAAHEKGRALERARLQRAAKLTPARDRQRAERARGRAQRLDARLGSERDGIGYWEPTLRPLPEYAINSVLLPTGKILYWGREPLVGGTRDNKGSAQLYDPQTGRSTHVPPPPVPSESDGAPIFCAGQTMLADGRVLLAGGNLAEPDPAGGKPEFSGLDYTFVFDPFNEADPWTLGPKMTYGRWYPTLTRLSDGDVLIFGGLDEKGQGRRNGDVDIWRWGAPVPDTLASLPAASRSDPSEYPVALPPDASVSLSLYPYTYLLPDGNVALAGPGRQDSAILDTATALDPAADPGSAWTQLGGPLPPYGPPQFGPPGAPSEIHQGGTGLIEPDTSAYSGSWNMLAMAGADDAGSGFHLARGTVDRLVAGPDAAAWEEHDPRDDLNRGRFYTNNVILPDGGTVVVGGGLGADYRTPGTSEDPASPGNYYVGEPPPPDGQQIEDPPIDRTRVELRRPGEREWRLGAAQQEWRTYHSTAVLLPDGKILSAGDDGSPKLTDDQLPAVRDNAEIYWPPYLFDGDECALRPVIRGVGAPGPSLPVLTYGEQLGIFSEHARGDMRAALVAPAATTHGVDMNQRLIPLRVDTTVSGGGLNVTMPASGSIAPPGYYLLFLVDADGTPSQARWVQVLAPLEAAGRRAGPPAVVSGPWPSPLGRRCVNPDGSQRSEPDPPRPPAPPSPPPPVAPPPATPPAAPAPPAGPVPKLPAKLELARATIRRGARELDLLAPITGLASGRIEIELHAAGARTRMSASIDADQRRVRVKRRIPAAQARLGTGILTLRYGGNTRTRPQEVRLRAAVRRADLRMRRPTLSDGGRLRAAGTISSRARGVVRLQLQFGQEGQTHTLRFRAPVSDGRWTIDERLSRDARDAIAARTGTLHSYTLFTGYLPARLRGEMRSYQVLGAR